MVNLDWCKKQRLGIKLVRPSTNLFKEYIENAEESIRVLASIRGTESNMWLATTKYYVEYFTAYAFLMRVGVKSEIHDCTIKVFKKLEQAGKISFKVSDRLGRGKELRIDNQYYLKNRPVQVDIGELRNFVLKIKQATEELSEEDIASLQEFITG